jgi:hypothetical protein
LTWRIGQPAVDLAVKKTECRVGGESIMVDANNIASVLMTGAVIAFAMAGLAMIIQAKGLASKALLVGIALTLAASLGGRAIASVSSLSPMTLLIAGSALLGVLVLLRGGVRLALSLLWPAVSNWALWPILWPYVREDWPLIMLSVAPFTVFILIWLLQKVLRPIYGEHVADHVAATYMVRTLDASGRGVGWLVAAPFRVLWSAFTRR